MQSFKKVVSAYIARNYHTIMPLKSIFRVNFIA